MIGAPQPADEFRFDPRAVAGRRLLVATPMYEGMCHALYARGLVELALRCRELGVALDLRIITNQASLNHARAFIAGAFLHSNAQHLMMIDADVGFAAADVLSLLALQAGGGHDVIGAAYSHKVVKWDQVRLAAGAAANIDLARVAGTMAVNLGADGGELRLDRPQPVSELASGFIMVGRDAVERLYAAYPEFNFRTDPEMRAAFGLGDTACALFDTMIDGEGKYLSEDYAFCRRVRAAGIQIWLCPWIELTHVGNMAFTGSVSEIARLSTLVTAQ